MSDLGTSEQSGESGRSYRVAYGILLFAIVLILGLVFGYQFDQVSSFSFRTNRIMVWHGWGEEGHQTLEELVGRFNSIRPDIRIILVDVAEDDLLDQYRERAELGLGPDILIGPNDWIATLADAQLIDPIVLSEAFDATRFSSAVWDTARYQNDLYGYPLVLQTPALYYNKSLTDEAVESFADLVTATETGRPVGISLDPQTTFAMIGAFGMPIVSAQEDVVNVSELGFVTWAEWVKETQANPDIFFTTQTGELDQLFFNGELAYYVGPYQVKERYQSQFESGNVEFELGVSPLPRSASGIARPLIQTEMIYFNYASSAGQRDSALVFAGFLTNEEQNSFLLRELEVAPANQKVRIDRRIFDQVYPYTQGSLLGIRIPHELKQLFVDDEITDVYTNILTGAQETNEIFCELEKSLLDRWGGSSERSSYCVEGENG